MGGAATTARSGGAPARAAATGGGVQGALCCMLQCAAEAGEGQGGVQAHQSGCSAALDLAQRQFAPAAAVPQALLPPAARLRPACLPRLRRSCSHCPPSNPLLLCAFTRPGLAPAAATAGGPGLQRTRARSRAGGPPGSTSRPLAARRRRSRSCLVPCRWGGAGGGERGSGWRRTFWSAPQAVVLVVHQRLLGLAAVGGPLTPRRAAVLYVLYHRCSRASVPPPRPPSAACPRWAARR